jgi:hypothetical protein
MRLVDAGGFRVAIVKGVKAMHMEALNKKKLLRNSQQRWRLS